MFLVIAYLFFFCRMDEPIELHQIMEHTTSVVDETAYETPVASRDEENEYMKIDTLAERMTTSRTTRDNPTRNDGGVDVSKPSPDAYALRKVQIFCLILLVMLVISSVTIGVLINMMVSYNLVVYMPQKKSAPLVFRVTSLLTRNGCI